MKSSEMLLEAAQGVEAGEAGLYGATIYAGTVKWSRAMDFIDRVMPKRPWKFAPITIPQNHRATILCLAAAIAESEGD